MSFVTDCIKENLPLWESCLDTPFLRGMTDGSLPEDCFIGYIIDDSLYLREYAKIFAYGIAAAKTMDEIKAFYSLLSFVNEAESSTRLYYLNHYQLSDRKLQVLPQRPENKAYTDTMLQAAKTHPTAAVCIMAALPCMLSYGYIFGRILKECRSVQQTPYARFVNDYADGSYDRLCKEWIAFAETACADLSETEKAFCRFLFTSCSKHEIAFWKMSEKPREDIRLCRL